MTRQKKITGKAEEVEYIPPLETLLSFLYLPHKVYRTIYINIAERRLSSKPLIQSEESLAYLAQQTGIEPALMAEKIKNMVRMKWVELEQVGERDVNQIFVLSPIWRYKPGIDQGKFAIALQEYKAAIVQDKEHQMNTQEIYALMNSVCSHTEEKIDSALCLLARWEECKTCSHSPKRNKKS
jgi:hypothetical protein